jgi:uncharacterized membrane protein
MKNEKEKRRCIMTLPIMRKRSIQIVFTALNAALYAVIGVMTFLGIFAPVLGVVRFWPGVFVPAVFAVLFGPIVGGLGAAIGIFLSDMVIHGNALLSVTVGVPANFIMFYIIGYLSNRKVKKEMSRIFLIAAMVIVVILIVVSQSLPWEMGETMVWMGVGLISLLILVLLGFLWPRWIMYQISVTIGNLIGSLIVGIGVWGFSQYFLLPGGEQSLPVIAASMWTVWTFMNQIPFLTILVPPVLKAVYAAFPRFRVDSSLSSEL